MNYFKYYFLIKLLTKSAPNVSVSVHFDFILLDFILSKHRKDEAIRNS